MRSFRQISRAARATTVATRLSFPVRTGTTAAVNNASAAPPLDPKAEADKAGTSYLDTRASYHASAMEDFVADYRELGRLAMWDELLASAGPDFRALDVCSGTGRFTQAFYELVLKPQNLKVIHDYTDLCGHSLDVLRDRMTKMGQSPNRVFAGDCRLLTSLIEEPYDLVVNMHGLYGVPKDDVKAAVQSMYEVLKPGGSMVLAIGTGDSLYQRVPIFLHRAGLLEAPYTNSKDVQKGLEMNGIDFTLDKLVYYEEFKTSDKEGLQRFIMDECAGNTFTVDDAQNVSSDLEKAQNAVAPLMNLYLEPREQKYRFKQEIAVFRIEKKVEMLPEMLGNSSFYADSYTRRRNASTMQSNMINWLKTQSGEKILSGLPASAGRDLKMLSVGCGDGELDFSIMEGCKSAIKSGGQFAGVDFKGLEPNGELRTTFAEKLKEAQGAGELPATVKTELIDTFFDGRFADADTSKPDLVVLGHVLYYFGGVKEKMGALRRAIQIANPEGRVVVIHQAAQGVPELQNQLLPTIRGSTKDMFTADDIEKLLNRELKDDIKGFVRHDIEAFLDISEVLKGSPKGIETLSFCLEADHRTATDSTLARSIASFEQRSQESAEPGRAGGPFLAEPVVCFVIEPRSL